MNGMVFWSCVTLILVVLSCSIGICSARCIPFSMSRSGYFCLRRNPLSSVSRLSLVSTSSTTVQIFLARQYGMFRFVCVGWHDLKFRY